MKAKYGVWEAKTVGQVSIKFLLSAADEITMQLTIVQSSND